METTQTQQAPKTKRFVIRVGRMSLNIFQTEKTGYTIAVPIQNNRKQPATSQELREVTGKAKCNPGDTFCSHTGVKLAVERSIEKIHQRIERQHTEQIVKSRQIADSLIKFLGQKIDHAMKSKEANKDVVAYKKAKRNLEKAKMEYLKVSQNMTNAITQYNHIKNELNIQDLVPMATVEGHTAPESTDPTPA